MTETFQYDVFISHSAKDRPTARDLARRLRADGLHVTWHRRNLKQARTLVLLMSAHTFAAEWPTLEGHTPPFRDPADAQRRFIPLLVADCTPPDAIAIAAEAGQIFRPLTWSDWGIDGEIEFKDHKGRASGKRVYLQLKSGDSYLYHRKRDDVEVFTIKNDRLVEYWQAQAYSVMLVIRTSDGQIRWMNVTDYLKRHGPDTRQVVFDGEPFTMHTVRQLRDRALR